MPVLPAVSVEREPELLDGRDDDLVRVIVGFEAADERRGAGVLLDAVLLETVELLAGLAVEILAVDDEDALMDALVGLEQRRGPEGGQRLARAGRMPDVAVAAVLVDAVDDGLDGIDLVRAHHQKLPLGCDENHVPAYGLGKRALGEEPVGEVVEMRDPGVVLVRELVDRKEPLVRVEGEVPRVVAGEVPRVRPVGDDEDLNEAEQRPGVSVARIVPVADDLLHRPPGADPSRLQLDLHDRDAVDQEHDVVAVMAVVRVDAKLVDDLEVVLAPVPDVDEGVVERRAVVARERFPVSEGTRRFVYVGRDGLFDEPLELAVSERDTVQGFELFPEVRLKRCSVTDVWAVFVFEIPQLRDKGIFKFPLGCICRHREGLLPFVRHCVIRLSEHQPLVLRQRNWPFQLLRPLDP